MVYVRHDSGIISNGTHCGPQAVFLAPWSGRRRPPGHTHLGNFLTGLSVALDSR
jgi:hypothetical protein